MISTHTQRMFVKNKMILICQIFPPKKITRFLQNKKQILKIISVVLTEKTGLKKGKKKEKKKSQPRSKFHHFWG
jgi:hypothetical protein